MDNYIEDSTIDLSSTDTLSDDSSDTLSDDSYQILGIAGQPVIYNNLFQQITNSLYPQNYVNYTEKSIQTIKPPIEKKTDKIYVNIFKNTNNDKNKIKKQTIQEEAEQKAREEAEKRAREEAEQKAREEAEQKAREEAEQKAREEAERRAREDIINTIKRLIRNMNDNLMAIVEQYNINKSEIYEILNKELKDNKLGSENVLFNSYGIILDDSKLVINNDEDKEILKEQIKVLIRSFNKLLKDIKDIYN